MDPSKRPFANTATTPANSTVLHLAARELRLFMGGSRFWLILGGASVTVALAGPFYTLERLSFSGRLIYWGATAITTGILMTFLSMVMRHIAAARGVHWIPASLAAGALGILPTMALVYVANRLSTLDPGSVGFWNLFPYVSVPVVLITVLINALNHGSDTETADPAANPTPAEDAAASLLFSKLPATLGRDIVAIQAKDHYIDVTTPQGNALILMRLSDAEQDLAPLNGMRVHRSWWVSLKHIERIEKGTSGPELRLSTGQTVPVARGQRAELRAIVAQQRP